MSDATTLDRPISPDPALRVLLLSISRATRAFQDGDNAALKAVNESLQPLVDAAMARILAKGAECRQPVAGQAESDRLAADAQRWAMIRDTVIRLDAQARPGLPMGDDDIEGLVLQILEHAARKSGRTHSSSALPGGAS